MSNWIETQYRHLLEDILEQGVKKTDRTGTGTISLFGRQIRHNMKDGFPLLTTKKMFFKGIVTELLWFLRGDTNIKYLVDNNCHIWDGDAYKNYLKLTTDTEPLSQEEFINKIKQNEWGFAKTWGDLGPIYGKQWRSWGGYNKTSIIQKEGLYDEIKFENKKGIDQIQNSINLLKTDPDSRRNIVNAWNVGELDQMVLPPCHTDFQFFTRELSLEERTKLLVNKSDNKKDFYDRNGRLIVEDESVLNDSNIPKRAISLMWNQRSVDTFLGLPFNIASYGLLLEIIAKEVNMVPDELIGNLGDVHLYSNHIEQAKEQLTRKPYKLPKLNFSWYIENWSTEEAKKIRKDSFDAYIRQMKPSDFVIENYQSHPAIKAPLSN
jgi:thymidylate synthase